MAGAGFGGPLWGKEKYYTQKTNWKIEIKDGHNGTKMGPSNMFGVISLDSEFQLSSSSNDSDFDKSISSNFCHQEGSSTIFKISVMLGW